MARALSWRQKQLLLTADIKLYMTWLINWCGAATAAPKSTCIMSETSSEGQPHETRGGRRRAIVISSVPFPCVPGDHEARGALAESQRSRLALGKRKDWESYVTPENKQVTRAFACLSSCVDGGKVFSAQHWRGPQLGARFSCHQCQTVLWLGESGPPQSYLT